MNEKVPFHPHEQRFAHEDYPSVESISAVNETDTSSIDTETPDTAIDRDTARHREKQRVLGHMALDDKTGRIGFKSALREELSRNRPDQHENTKDDIDMTRIGRVIRMHERHHSTLAITDLTPDAVDIPVAHSPKNTDEKEAA